MRTHITLVHTHEFEIPPSVLPVLFILDTLFFPSHCLSLQSEPSRASLLPSPTTAGDRRSHRILSPLLFLSPCLDLTSSSLLLPRFSFTPFSASISASSASPSALTSLSSRHPWFSVFLSHTALCNRDLHLLLPLSHCSDHRTVGEPQRHQRRVSASLSSLILFFLLPPYLSFPCSPSLTASFLSPATFSSLSSQNPQRHNSPPPFPLPLASSTNTRCSNSSSLPGTARTGCSPCVFQPSVFPCFIAAFTLRHCH
ncbi:uncharacterized protein DS421_15g502060 [Arachis hypogaea]|nr:uncharacterized protein DS421_15g502060 [Arachis hypogaea]